MQLSDLENKNTNNLIGDISEIDSAKELELLYNDFLKLQFELNLQNNPHPKIDVALENWCIRLQRAIDLLFISPLDIGLMTVSFLSLVTMKVTDILSTKNADIGKESDIEIKYEFFKSHILTAFHTIVVLFKSSNFGSLELDFKNSNSSQKILEDSKIGGSADKKENLSVVPSLMISVHWLFSLFSFIKKKFPDDLQKFVSVGKDCGLIDEVLFIYSNYDFNLEFVETSEIDLGIFYNFGILNLDGWTMFGDSEFGIIPESQLYKYSGNPHLYLSVLNSLDSATYHYQTILCSRKNKDISRNSKTPAPTQEKDIDLSKKSHGNNQKNNKKNPEVHHEPSNKLSNSNAARKNYHLYSIGFIYDTCVSIAEILDIKIHRNTIETNIFAENPSLSPLNPTSLNLHDYSNTRNTFDLSKGDAIIPSQIGVVNAKNSDDDEEELIVFTGKRSNF
ncbi:hypothetical protein AYI68_g3558 [Smittium mucronatum]|uniref:Uncharacterized protein n=1 Tax=Smittium mucronatum TaxID=133383 RepID=A0A1R0GZS5_9FUNG|nr:hypothetical protein AYI68_g3558 [Smittium mucronatum]